MLPEQLSKKQEAALSDLLAVKVMGWSPHSFNPELWEPFEDANQALVVLQKIGDEKIPHTKAVRLTKMQDKWLGEYALEGILSGPSRQMCYVVESETYLGNITRIELEETLNDE